MASTDERKAIQACRRREIAGLRVLYENYKDRVFRTCWRVIGDQMLAEDVTQDVFLRLFEQIRRYDERSSFSTWLYRLAMNVALNAVRSRKRADRLHPPRPTNPDPGEGDDVERLLAALSLEHRAILVLREIQGLGYRDIAEVLEIPTGTVMSRLARAREELSRNSHDRTE